MKACYKLVLASGIMASFAFFPKTLPFDSKPIVIAELFTSEGCSSCPAAEETLKEMVDLTAKENISVVGLAFHITYWDHLGWKDPYGKPEFTKRQKKYMTILSSQQYTPQVVMNGEYEFVGGNPFIFRNTLAKVTSVPAVYSLTAEAAVNENEILVNYSLDKNPGGELLNIALVETSIENQVSKGENKNRLLKHYNVVRHFESISLEKSGEWKMTAPSDVKLNNCEIVLYVQHRRNMKILGASKVGLNN